MSTRFDRDVQGKDITRSQWTLVALVARHPGATQKFIADALEMSEAAAGRLVDRLCDDGLLERKPKPDDRRAWCVHLTDQASPMLTAIGDLAVIHEDRLFAGLEDEDLEQLATLIARMQANLTGA